MRFAVLVCLLGTLFLACANDPADVRFGDGTITIYGYTLPLENFRIHGYENIPTPTLDPAKTTCGHSNPDAAADATAYGHGNACTNTVAPNPARCGGYSIGC